MEPDARPPVSVVIPTRNAGSGLGALLESVRAQQVPGGLEIIVVDSESSDGTADRARRAGATVLSVPQRQFNHGGTRNLAMSASTGEFVAFTVQDALPADGEWLRRLLGPLIERGDVAGSYGLQVARPEAGLLARTRSSLWCERYALPAVQELATGESWADMSPPERLERIRFDNVTSCIRRAAWERLRLPELGYGEDTAWAMNALQAGWKIAYVPTAQVWHSHERGWMYELRRAYVDGCQRARLVGWPSAGLPLRAALATLRRVAFFGQTSRFDPVQDADAARSFLSAEMYHCGGSTVRPHVRLYQEALQFAWSLTERASQLAPGGLFRPGEWIGLLRFALAVIVGRGLGTSAPAALSSGHLGWRLLHRALHRGV